MKSVLEERKIEQDHKPPSPVHELSLQILTGWLLHPLHHWAHILGLGGISCPILLKNLQSQTLTFPSCHSRHKQHCFKFARTEGSQLLILATIYSNPS
jgi:hypothetical protein